MGFFSDLMGGSARDDIRSANRGASGLLKRGMRDAQDSINTGITQQLDALGRGNTGATNALNQGYATARGDVTRGATRAEDAINTQQRYIQQTLNPFLQSGRGAQSLYDNALGVNGTGAASSFYDNYAGQDPFRQFNEDMTNKAMERSFNASGNLGSGRAALAASRANLERGSQDLNRYLDRLSGQAQQGGQYASQLAGYANNAGNTVAGLRSNLGAQQADLATNRGQDLGRLSYGYGQDRGSIMAGRGQSNADLQYGLAQQLAGNRLNLGSAVAAGRSTGVNNLLGLGGLAIQAMTPGASGISAAGNFASALPRF